MNYDEMDFVISMSSLTIKQLREIVDEFVTRDGSDFTDMKTKFQQVFAQLRSGEALLVRDEEGRNINIILKAEYKKRRESLNEALRR